MSFVGLFSRAFRDNGMIRLSTYLIKYKVGDYVDIKCNPAVHKGMPFKGFHGRTGIVFNVTKRALGVRVNKLVNGRIINKMIHVRVEHVRPSKCRQEVLRRVKENEAAKSAAAESGDLSRPGEREDQLRRIDELHLAPKQGRLPSSPLEKSA